MKKVIGPPLPQSSLVAASTRNITVDELYDRLGGDSILRTTLDFEEGTYTEEIVDVNAAEKRKLGQAPQRRHVKPRTDEGPGQTLTPPIPPRTEFPPAPIPPAPISHQPQPVYIEEIPDDEMPDMGIAAQPRSMAPQSQPNADGGEVKRKYHLASELSQTVDTAQIGEKIMDTPIQLSIHEVLAVSGDIAGYLHEQTKKRRIPLENPPSASASVPGTAVHATSVAVPVPSV